ncbi:hypothetical protein ACFW9W_35835, partial [Streptomyces sp. NPDC059468]
MTEPEFRETSVLRSVPQAEASGHEGEPLPRADVCETHTAILFFVGDRVYKVKKQVELGFLDYTTASARQAACEREVTLNRRFTPDVYL